MISEEHNTRLIAEKRRVTISVIDDLLADHKLIAEMADLMDLSVEKIEKGVRISPETISKEIEFCRDFISKWHEQKEEQVLMPALNKAGYPTDRGPIWETTEDHRRGRSILRRLAAVEKTAKEEQRIRDFAEYSAAYAMYLFEHIRDEENGLYRAARLAISSEAGEEMLRSSSSLDAELSKKGGRERYSRIVDELRKELA
ncbi:MAG: hemerythrin domain-containing protein [Thermoplasmata archaeon]